MSAERSTSQSPPQSPTRSSDSSLSSDASPDMIPISALKAALILDVDDGDSFSYASFLAEAIREGCERILMSERSNVNLARFWKIALKQLLPNVNPEDRSEDSSKNHFSLSELIGNISKRLKALAPKLQNQCNAERAETWELALDNLLEEYESDLYQILSKVVEAKCQLILTPKSGLDPSAILHQVSSRAKTSKSLTKKAKKVADNLSDLRFDPDNPISTEVARHLLDKSIRDLAGIRILVYFPDDVPKVVQAIRKDSGLKIIEGTVSFTKSRVDHREKDKEALKALKAMEGDDSNNYLENLIYSHGPWLSEPISLDSVAQRWRHSGYRAVHLHVKLNPKLAEQWDAAEHNEVEGEGENQPGEDPGQGGPVEEDEESDPQQIFDLKLKTLKKKHPEVNSAQLSGKWAEIQITTVVMHAWSQVEHDIIYKNPFKLPLSNTMLRMLDGINGLSITSEIMLEELQGKTAEIKGSLSKPFSTDIELLAQLNETYLSEGTVSQWEANPSAVEILHSVIFGRGVDNGDPESAITPTLVSLQPYIPELENVGLTVPTQLQRPDIAVAILKATGLEKDREFLERVPNIADTAAGQLRQILLFFNAFSIMLAIDAYFVFEQLKKQVPWGLKINKVLKKLDQMKDFFLNRIDPGSQPHQEALQEFARFAARFLAVQWCKQHDVAVALARHSFFICGSSDHWKSPYWSKTRKVRLGPAEDGGSDHDPPRKPIKPGSFKNFCSKVRLINFSNACFMPTTYSSQMGLRFRNGAQAPIFHLPTGLGEYKYGNKHAGSFGEMVGADRAELEKSLPKLELWLAHTEVSQNWGSEVLKHFLPDGKRY